MFASIIIILLYWNIKYKTPKKPIQTLWKSNTSKSAIIPVKSRGFSFYQNLLYSNTLASVSRGQPLRAARYPLGLRGAPPPPPQGREQAPCTSSWRASPSAFGIHPRSPLGRRKGLPPFLCGNNLWNWRRYKGQRGLRPARSLSSGALPPAVPRAPLSAASWLLRSFPEKLRWSVKVRRSRFRESGLTLTRLGLKTLVLIGRGVPPTACLAASVKKRCRGLLPAGVWGKAPQ